MDLMSMIIGGSIFGKGGASSVCKKSHIVNVDKLPDDNVQAETVYKVINESSKEIAEIYYILSEDDLEYYGLTNPVNYLEILKHEVYPYVTNHELNIYVVDSLPEKGKIWNYYDSIKDCSINNCYVLAKDTSQEVYVYYDYGNGDYGWDTLSWWWWGPYNGTIEDLKEATQEGYYIVKREAISTKTSYGISDNLFDKNVFEYTEENGWKECDLIVEVEKLPEEDVNNDKIYKVVKNTQQAQPSTEIWMVLPEDWAKSDGLINPVNFKITSMRDDYNLKIHAVDTLPEQGEYWYSNEEGTCGNIYVVQNNLRAEVYLYYYYNEYDQFWMTLGEYYNNELSYITSVSDPLEIDTSKVGYYIVNRETDIGTSTKTTYGIPNDNADKQLYEYTEDAGWQKCEMVTNVASLPNEEIDNGKIYKMSKEIPGRTDIWMTVDDVQQYYLGIISPNNVIDMNAQYAALDGYKAETYIHEVEELPEVGALSYLDTETSTQIIHLYIFKNNLYGSPILFYQNDQWSEWYSSDDLLGVIDDPSLITSPEVGYYFVSIPDTTEYIYGIPDISNNKKLFEYTELAGWSDKDGQNYSKALVEGTIEEVNDNNVTSIRPRGFKNCHKLKQAKFDNVTTIKDEAFAECTSLVSFSAPLATELGPNAFYNCNLLEEVDFQEVTELNNGNIFENNFVLKTVNMPNLTSVGNEVFRYCRSLEHVDFPNLTSVGERAFNNSGLTEFNFPKLTSIEAGAFAYTNITEISLPNFTTIGATAFSYCDELLTADFPDLTRSYNTVSYCKKLQSVNMPNVTEINQGEFRSCYQLTSISLPKITTIPGNAFESSGIVNFDLPNVTRIYSKGMRSTAAEKIHFPSVTAVENLGFESNTQLTTVSFSSKVYFNQYAFQSCNQLRALILRSEELCTAGNRYLFPYCYHILGEVNATHNPNGDKDGYIYVPSALVESYKTATNWSYYADNFRALEDYTVDGTITGELDPEKI